MNKMNKMKRLLTTLALGLGLVLFLLWLLGGALPKVARAQGPDGHAIYYVAPGGDCGGASPCYASVQAAIDAADDPGDVVKIAAGRYTDVSVRPRNDTTTTGVVTQVVYISKTVTVRGGYTTTNWTAPDPEANPTTLDAQRQGRVLYITGEVSPTVGGLHITGGDATGLDAYLYGDAGGGVYIITATAIFSNNQVFSNTAGYGGGLYLRGSAAMLSGNTVTANSATYDGGGLFLDDSAATLNGNAVTSNTADDDGGGLQLSNSDAMLSGNTVISNTATEEGGGLRLLDSNATLSGNTITANTASSFGGGLCLWDSDATLSGNTVTANAAGSGGGLCLFGSDAALSDNTVTANTATQNGGGLCLQASDATLSGNAIALNSASWGGGLYLWEGNDATLTNNVVADNQANTAGSGLYIDHSFPCLLHTTIARNSGGDGSGVYVTDWAGTYSTVALTNTILVSHTVGISVTGGNTVMANGILWHDTPISVSQAATATVTVQNQHTGDPAFAPDGYHLTTGSAAIDNGINAGVTTDIDGDSRPQAAAPDLGADEYVEGVTVPLTGVTLSGPTTGAVNAAHSFTATVQPSTATEPITYVWQATGQSPVTHTGGLSHTVIFTWNTTGAQAITVTAANVGGTASDMRLITIGPGYTLYLPLVLRAYPPLVPTGADLVVTGIALDPASPGVGQPITVSVTVENQGSQAPGSWFFLDLYVDPASPPDDRTDLGLYYGYGPADLGPGESYQVNFTHTFASDGSHTLYAQADTYDGFNGSPDYGMIQESNETNNIYGPVSVNVGPCAEGIANGGFEHDGDWELPITAYPADYTTAITHSGNRSMRVGIVEPADNRYSYSSARQLVTIPADVISATLRFWLYPLSGKPAALDFPVHPLATTPQEATMPGDTQYVLVLDEYDRWIDTLLWQRSDDRQWTFHESGLMGYAGRSIKLHFGVYNDGWDGITGMYVDDVSLEFCFSVAQQNNAQPERKLPRDPPPALRNH